MKRVELAPLDSLEPGVPKLVPLLAHPPPKRSVILIRLSASPQNIRAYWNVCQHLPIPLDAGAMELPASEELVCITHGAAYQASDGLCVRGPCEGTQLESVPLQIEGGKVWALLGSAD